MTLVIDYYSEQRKWKEHVNKMNTEGINTKINVTLSAKRTKINWTSSEEMGGKYESLTGHQALYLTERRSKYRYYLHICHI
jgi:hypothetical protein